MAYNPSQPRHPAGSSQGGEWAPAHAASSGVVSVEDQAERNRKRQQTREINEHRRLVEAGERGQRISDYVNSAKILSRPPYNDADKALNARLHKDALALADKLNLTRPGNVAFTSGLQSDMSLQLEGGKVSWENMPTDPTVRAEMVQRVEAAMIYRVAAVFEGLPEATKEYIEKHGLELTVKAYDPNDPKDNFELNGEKMQAAGYASGYDGPLKVTLNAFPRSEEYKDGKSTTYLSPTDLSVIAHEMGHISMDVSGNINRQRSASLPGGGEGTWDDLSTSKSIMFLLASEYQKQAATFEAAAIRMDLEGRKGDAEDFQRRASEAKADAERTYAGGREMFEAVEEMAANEKQIAAWAHTHYDAMGDLTMAVKAEGGLTYYAEKWNQHPEYGEKGYVRDPVHRGVHESLAEMESFYMKALVERKLTSDDPVKEFASMIARGAKTDHEVRSSPPPGPPSPKAFPKFAEAWVTWRKVMDKGVGVGRRSVKKLSPEKQEIITRNMRGHRTYKDWDQTLKNAKARRIALLGEVGLDENAAPR